MLIFRKQSFEIYLHNKISHIVSKIRDLHLICIAGFKRALNMRDLSSQIPLCKSSVDR